MKKATSSGRNLNGSGKINWLLENGEIFVGKNAILGGKGKHLQKSLQNFYFLYASWRIFFLSAIENCNLRKSSKCHFIQSPYSKCRCICSENAGKTCSQNAENAILHFACWLLSTVKGRNPNSVQNKSCCYSESTNVPQFIINTTVLILYHPEGFGHFNSYVWSEISKTFWVTQYILLTLVKKSCSGQNHENHL